MKSISLNLTNFVPYHLTTYTDLSEIPYIINGGKISFNWESDNFTCDLKLIWEVIKDIDENTVLNPNKIKKYKLISNLIGKNNFLPNIKDEWVKDEKELLIVYINRFNNKMGKI
jgi:hypothetical protein